MRMISAYLVQQFLICKIWLIYVLNILTPGDLNSVSIKLNAWLLGTRYFLCEPHWSLGHVAIENTYILNILGTVFSKDGKRAKHVDSRILKCHQSYYVLSCIGMPYPGLPVDLKCHIWQTTCRPILTFCLETMFLSKTMLSRLNSLQGSIIKNLLALTKHSRHSSGS